MSRQMTHTDDMSRLSNLELARRKAKASPTWLAELAGVARTTYYRDEKPDADIPKTRVEIYAAVLGVKPAFLMGWEPSFDEGDFK